MKYLVLIAGIFFWQMSFSQNTVTSSGGTVSGSQGGIDYSVGQICISTYSSTGGIITEGVQQPHEVLIPILVQDLPGLQEFTIAPNPTDNFVKLQNYLKNQKDLVWELRSLSGVLTDHGNITEEVTILSFLGYASGSYILTIRDQKESIICQYKIIKK
ncbi:MAG: T9SS type A sorting domain-containing protein [Syntrophothermus sp.]